MVSFLILRHFFTSVDGYSLPAHLLTLEKNPWKGESIYEFIFKPGTRLPIGGKIGERSEPRGNLGRRKGGHLWAAAGLAPIFFVFDPVLPFSPTAHAEPGTRLKSGAPNGGFLPNALKTLF